MQEGGICLWDLAEPDDQHSVQQSSQGSPTLRRPSFTTEAAAEGATAGAITGLQWLPGTGVAVRACLQPRDATLRCATACLLTMIPLRQQAWRPVLSGCGLPGKATLAGWCCRLQRCPRRASAAAAADQPDSFRPRLPVGSCAPCQRHDLHSRGRAARRQHRAAAVHCSRAAAWQAAATRGPAVRGEVPASADCSPGLAAWQQWALPGWLQRWAGVGRVLHWAACCPSGRDLSHCWAATCCACARVPFISGPASTWWPLQEWRLEDPALHPRQLQDADPVTCHTGVAAVACCPSLPGTFATGDDAGRVAVFNTRTSIAVFSIQVHGRPCISALYMRDAIQEWLSGRWCMTKLCVRPLNPVSCAGVPDSNCQCSVGAMLPCTAAGAGCPAEFVCMQPEKPQSLSSVEV